MAYIAVNYTYDATRPDEVAAGKPAHREFLRSLADEGVNVASGPYTGEAPAALIILKTDSPDSALALLEEDPLWKDELIAERVAHVWEPNIGVFAEA